MTEYYILDVRKVWSKRPYLTFWRPNNEGYTYPLAWAGKYTQDEIDKQPDYYYKHRFGSKRILERYPVPCQIVNAMIDNPDSGTIDGNVGPIIRNTVKNKTKLRNSRYIPIP
jgi:hypothetical protein